MKNILIIGAHPDDAELMAGGSIVKWLKEGKKIHVITYTDGELILPDGSEYRTKKDALSEQDKVANFLGYSYSNIGCKNLHLSYSDQNVVHILSIIDKLNIDTIVCPHIGDSHHDHEVASRLAIAASRRVPNVMMGQINYFLNNFFTPNVFVDITDTWDKKIEALELYESQWRKDWYEFLDATSIYYGKMIGVKRAEGYYSNKIILK